MKELLDRYYSSTINVYRPTYIRTSASGSCGVCDNKLIREADVDLPCQCKDECRCSRTIKDLYTCNYCIHRLCEKCDSGVLAVDHHDNTYYCGECFDEYKSRRIREATQSYSETHPDPSTDEKRYRLDSQFDRRRVSVGWTLDEVKCNQCDVWTKTLWLTDGDTHYCSFACQRIVFEDSNPDPSNGPWKYEVDYRIWEWFIAEAPCTNCSKNVVLRYPGMTTPDHFVERELDAVGNVVVREDNPCYCSRECEEEHVQANSQYLTIGDSFYERINGSWKMKYLNTCSDCSSTFYTNKLRPSICSDCGVSKGSIKIENGAEGPRIVRIKTFGKTRHGWSSPSTHQVDQENFDYVCPCAQCV